MEILLTGNVALISQGVIERLEQEYRCIVFGKNGIHLPKKNVIIPIENEQEKQTEYVYATHDFETVVYFSYALDGTIKSYTELENLEYTLYHCKKNHIRNFIYICSNDIQKEQDEKGFETNISRQILIQACEKLCKKYSKDVIENVKVLRVPYLYNTRQSTNQVYQWTLDAVNKRAITLRGAASQITDFLWDEDLAELLFRMIDEPGNHPYLCMDLSGKNEMSFERLGNIFKECDPQIKIEYENRTKGVPTYKEGKLARQEYGWVPMGHIEKDLLELFYKMKSGVKKREKFNDIKHQIHKAWSKIGIIMEMIIIGVLMECLHIWTRSNVLLQFLDFRLIYVVIMGTVHGMKVGVLASVLACICYGNQALKESPWQSIFYNVVNWIPFATYFFVGAVSGYIRDKHDQIVLELEQEQEVLEQKYLFLNRLYQRVLEKKEQYSGQIIDYQDSFGKLYSVVTKLNSTLPERVYLEAITILEEVLGSSCVAIYTIQEGKVFGRLRMCSRNINKQMKRSICFEDYPKMSKMIKEHELFINIDCDLQYPDYAMPFYREKKMAGVIFLVNATEQQMQIEFANKFHVLVNLIQDSLIRAAAILDLENSYIKDTIILKKEKFKEILDIRHETKEKQYVEYILLRIIGKRQEWQELSNRIGGLIRQEDILGEGEDAHLYLLLSQTQKENISIIGERLKTQGIQYEFLRG